MLRGARGWGLSPTLRARVAAGHPVLLATVENRLLVTPKIGLDKVLSLCYNCGIVVIWTEVV